MSSLSPTNTKDLPRTCCKCKKGDHEIVEGFDDNRKPLTKHFIRPDVYPFPKDRTGLSESEKIQGWFVKVLDGQACRARWICQDCYAREQETKEWADRLKRELKSKVNDKELRNSFYVQEWCLND